MVDKLVFKQIIQNSFRKALQQRKDNVWAKYWLKNL